MGEFCNRLKGTKTLYAVVGAVLVAVGSAVAGQITPAECALAIGNALVLLFVRDGVAKAA